MASLILIISLFVVLELNGFQQNKHNSENS